MKTNHVGFDFSKFNEAGLKPVLSLFKRKKTPVLTVDATNKSKRNMVAGVTTKSANFYFEDGQRLTLSVTAQGGIFQVKLNGRIIPVKNTDDLNKAVTELSNQIKSNSASFTKRLKARQNKALQAETSIKKPRAIRTTATQLKETKSQVSDMKASIKSLESEHTKAQEKQTTVAEKLSGVLSEIESMLARRNQLTELLGV